MRVTYWYLPITSKTNRKYMRSKQVEVILCRIDLQCSQEEPSTSFTSVQLRTANDNYRISQLLNYITLKRIRDYWVLFRFKWKSTWYQGIQFFCTYIKTSIQLGSKFERTSRVFTWRAVIHSTADSETLSRPIERWRALLQLSRNSIKYVFKNG